jgi:Asp-tRNA(Asn)/Glu-tRNA(Gln) amidotransferase C subunit
LLALGVTIPIIGKFAMALQKALEVIKQASRKEDSVVRLHDHAVDIIEGLLDHLRDLSRITGFDDALNKLIDVLEEISSYISNRNSLLTKVMSATDTNLVTQVDIYIKNLTDRKDCLMDLISNIELNQAVESSTFSDQV